MSESTAYTHTPIDVQPNTHVNAPVNAHGWCFGLIPAHGIWLDDIIDWQKRQFRQAAVARRMAACWNACSQLSTEYLEQHAEHQAKPDESPAPERSRHVASMAAGIRAALSAARAAKAAPGQHADDIAVDWFADALKEKLAKQRAKGYDGWEDTVRCPTERLQAMLADHIGKGDPVDVGNFAMMLWSRGERTTANERTSDFAELRRLAEGVPEHIRLKGWFTESPAFGQQHVYADDFRGMGRQHIASLPAGKGYFGTLATFIAAASPTVIIRLIDAAAEKRPHATEAPSQATKEAR